MGTITQQSGTAVRKHHGVRVTDVAIVGLGYVGLPLATLASKSYKVHGIDTHASKIKDLQASTQKNMKFYTDFTSVEHAQVVIICVPTPVHDNFQPDLSPVEAAISAVAQHISKGTLVILESTVNPGICDDIVRPILQEVSGMECGKDFYLAHCPERINPGDPKWHVGNIARVVGASCSEGLKRALNFYRSIIDAEIKPMGSLKEAEAVKVVENSFRDINIAFVNELAMSFDRLGIDVVNVIDGAATKPFAFMPHYPGAGVGGHCIPVDPYYLIEYAQGHGFYHDFLRLARRINHDMPAYTAKQLLMALNTAEKSIANTVVTVLGLSYKPNISDHRESPSFLLIAELIKLGAKVRVYDPNVQNAVRLTQDNLMRYLHGKPHAGELVESEFDTLDSALDGSQSVVLATSHNEFKSMSPVFLSQFGIKAVVDGRNCLDKPAFEASDISYRGIGR